MECSPDPEAKRLLRLRDGKAFHALSLPQRGCGQLRNNDLLRDLQSEVSDFGMTISTFNYTLC